MKRPDIGGMESPSGDEGRRGSVSLELSWGRRWVVVLRTAVGETDVKTIPRTMLAQSSFRRSSASSIGARCADTKVISRVESPIE